MASKILASLLAGITSTFFRASIQAYQQALVNARRNGITPETLQKAATGAAATMALEEARKILGVEASASRPEVEKRYQHMWRINHDTSFYLQSKVFRAMETVKALEFGDQEPLPDPREPVEGKQDEGPPKELSSREGDTPPPPTTPAKEEGDTKER
jgi:hypothetical protein